MTKKKNYANIIILMIVTIILAMMMATGFIFIYNGQWLNGVALITTVLLLAIIIFFKTAAGDVDNILFANIEDQVIFESDAMVSSNFRLNSGKIFLTNKTIKCIMEQSNNKNEMIFNLKDIQIKYQNGMFDLQLPNDKYLKLSFMTKIKTQVFLNKLKILKKV